MSRRRAIWLVARREMLERGRSRGFLISLVVSVAIVVAGVFLPALIGEHLGPAPGDRRDAAGGADRRPRGDREAGGARRDDRDRAGHRERRGAAARRVARRGPRHPARRLDPELHRQEPGQSAAPAGRRRRVQQAARHRRSGELEPSDPERDTLVRVREHRRDPPVHLDLHVRDVGPDRRRRGEAEPCRRGRPGSTVEAARPAGRQGHRDRVARDRPAHRHGVGRPRPRASPWVGSRCPRRPRRRSRCCCSGSSSATPSTRRRWRSSARSRRAWRRRRTRPAPSRSSRSGPTCSPCSWP